MKIEKHNTIMTLIEGIDMHLGYAGYAVVGQQWKTDQLATPFNRLYLIESGCGILSTSKGHITLEPGKVYLLPAGLPCSYSCHTSLSLLFFHFNINMPNQLDLMYQVDHTPVIDFPLEQFSHLRHICEKTTYCDAFEVICSIYNIILNMSKEHSFHWDRIPVYSKSVAKVISEINSNLSAQLRIDDLARKCYISRSYLSRQFRKEVGMTIKQYINMQLINAAQWQLSHTDASIEEISNNLGFCNQFYFSESFKKYCRVSPLQYRNGTKY